MNFFPGAFLYYFQEKIGDNNCNSHNKYNPHTMEVNFFFNYYYLKFIHKRSYQDFQNRIIEMYHLKLVVMLLFLDKTNILNFIIKIKLYN